MKTRAVVALARERVLIEICKTAEEQLSPVDREKPYQLVRNVLPAHGLGQKQHRPRSFPLTPAAASPHNHLQPRAAGLVEFQCL